MHLQCHNCGWTQDDFWSEEYNPIRGLLNYENILVDVNRLDELMPPTEGQPKVTRRQLVLHAMRLATQRVEEMTYPVRPGKEGATCPKCQGRLILSRHRDVMSPV